MEGDLKEVNEYCCYLTLCFVIELPLLKDEVEFVHFFVLVVIFVKPALGLGEDWLTIVPLLW